MEIYWNRDLAELTIEKGRVLTCTNDVRNELNGRRALHDPAQVIRTIPGNHPYMPRKFPVGRWRIMGVKFRDKSDPDYGYLGPAFIQTNAFQVVSVWALDKNGGYDRQLDVTVTDTGYGFHFARDSRTTHGCGRLASESDALYFAKFVQSNSGIYINVSGS